MSYKDQIYSKIVRCRVAEQRPKYLIVSNLTWDAIKKELSAEDYEIDLGENLGEYYIMGLMVAVLPYACKKEFLEVAT